MRFDESEYRENFLKKHRGARGAPGDLLDRYAITLPAQSDAEIGEQLKKVRAYWNKIYTGKSSIAQVANYCRIEDQRLRDKHGQRMESQAWWNDQRSDRQKADQETAKRLADELTRKYGKLGVVPSGTLEQFAKQLGLAPGHALQAAKNCRLSVIADVTLPEAEPIRQFPALVKAMGECGAASVPELVHPGAGPFRIVNRYECLADSRKRLDMTAVLAQIQEADKLGKTATVDARRRALQILATAAKGGVNLDTVALYHAAAISRDSAATSAEIAAERLREAGVERHDAAVIAVLLAEQGTGPGSSAPDVPELLQSGRLREARAAAASLPLDSGERAEMARLVQEAQERLDQLLSAARTALAVPDEARAEQLLQEAALLSAEDAGTELAAVPPPPPARLRASGDGTEVRLFWRPAPGHGRDTVYAVRRSEQPRPLTAPSEGDPVYRDSGDACADPRAPVARPVQYAVFAVRDGRPPSRPALVTVTLVPPVTKVHADAGPASVALSWSARPEAQVEVTRTAAGQDPVPVPARGGGCVVSGLPQGQQQHFEVTAVYTGPDGRELRAAPQRVSATPRAEARPLTSLRARLVSADGALRVRVTWRPADDSEVRVVRCDRDPGFPPGTVVTPEQMAEAGEWITGTPVPPGPEQGFEAGIATGVHQLVPFSIGGTGVIAGKPVTVAVTDPVTHLSCRPFSDYATVSWQWPEKAQSAEVLWRVDGTEDVLQVDRGKYRAGVHVPLGRGPCEVEVRAVIRAGTTVFTSPPATTTVGQVVDTPIRYDVTRPVPSRHGWSRKVTFAADRSCDGVRVQMVASDRSVIPTRPQDGRAVLDITLSLTPREPRTEKVTVPRGTVWVKCFVISGPGTLVGPAIAKLRSYQWPR